MWEFWASYSGILIASLTTHAHFGRARIRDRPTRSPVMPRRSSRWKSLQLLRLEDRLTPALAVGLSTDNLLLFFDTATPGTIERVTPITGLQAGENLVGIDARPADRLLYGVGSTNQLYTINISTGA